MVLICLDKKMGRFFDELVLICLNKKWAGQSWWTVLKSAQYLQCLAGHINLLIWGRWSWYMILNTQSLILDLWSCYMTLNPQSRWLTHLEKQLLSILNPWSTIHNPQSSIQMAHTLGEAVAPRRNSVSANDVADSLLSSIKKRIRERFPQETMWECENGNLREKNEVHLPRQSAGGVDLSQGTLTGMANMNRS